MNTLLDKKAKVQVTKIKDPTSGSVLDESGSASCLNDYYVSVATKLSAKLPSSESVYEPAPVESSFVLRDPISCRRVTEVLKEFSPGKSSGCPYISSKLYLDAFEVLVEQLAFLLNLSLRTQTFPDAWKLSIVTPLPKKGDNTTPENTSPISLVHLCSKILEKIVNLTVMSYLGEHDILSAKQFGFVKNRSTSDCISVLTHSLFNNLNNNLITCCVFLDYSKAFDSVNHSILLHKLKLYGCRSISWFASYLNHRRQCVKITNSLSDVKPVVCGVPQGSVLGPTLFNLYVNDIASLPLNSKMLLYADDIVIYLSGTSVEDIFCNVQSDLDRIFDWSVSNKLSLSPSKTKALLIGRKCTLKKISFTQRFRLGPSEVDWVDHFCYLGVIIDKHLMFNLTIDQMHRKAAHRLKLFIAIRRNLTRHSAVIFAKSLILPYIDYGLFLLGIIS